VLRALTRLFAERRAPCLIRSDNGPEFIAQAIRDWLPRSAVPRRAGIYRARGALGECPLPVVQPPATR
jgi:transposase InsO family protein